ncbi:MAG: phospho-sugar mutase [Acutalibacteraceae bacterium]|nr:phospho-sugar mutase [Acutalibacteraceae bacterium]
MNTYEYWLTFDEETKKELEAITDKAEIEDRFYKELEFGTGGLRGIMGAGANRMNKYTVSKATKGLADYLNSSFEGEKSVAIAYDSRNNSRFFAEVSAGVLCGAGIRVYLFETLMPTPVLSFAVRYHKCTAGIVITASHNPKEYNGYKVYDEMGCQLVPEFADKVIACVNAVTDIKNIPCMSLEEAEKNGLLTYIGDDTLNAFLDEIKKQSVYNEKSELKIVYTPLHGTGNIPVRKILEGKNVSIVASQELPDGDFSTVRSPNPEEKDALNLALEQAEKEGADIVIGTDPDCDRVGVGVLHNGEYVLLTGNQTGALLVDFILGSRKEALPSNAAVVKTIVTSGIGAAIAEKHGAKTVQTLTGFKYIGEKICKWEKDGEHTFLFGYEESYGYLAGTHARDKDAVSASMLIAEMAAYYKNNGKTLVDALNGIYEEYGYYFDCLETFVLKGKEGAEKIQSAMSAMRESGNELFDDLDVLFDYSKGIDGLPKENVLRFDFKDGSWAAARPSGTEPKLKLYFSVKGENRAQAEERQKAIRNKLAEKIIG